MSDITNLVKNLCYKSTKIFVTWAGWSNQTHWRFPLATIPNCAERLLHGPRSLLAQRGLVVGLWSEDPWPDLAVHPTVNKSYIRDVTVMDIMYLGLCSYFSVPEQIMLHTKNWIMFKKTFKLANYTTSTTSYSYLQNFTN